MNILIFLCYWNAWFEASVDHSKYVIHGLCRLCNFSWAACYLRLRLFSYVLKIYLFGSIEALDLDLEC